MRQGDLLVQIDPAPFQAALNQATAKKAQDQAASPTASRISARTTVGSMAVTPAAVDQQHALVAQPEAQVQADQAAIENAQVQLAYTTITGAAYRPRRLPHGRPGQHRPCQRHTGVLTIAQS